MDPGSSLIGVDPELLADGTPAAQDEPSVAADAAGNFLVAWSSNGQDGSSDGVFGQRFSMIVPVELMQLGVE